MPETKINVSSPFIKKVSDPSIDSAQVKIWIYEGDKYQVLGDADYTLYRDAPTGVNDISFDLDRIIKDYLEPNINTPLNDNLNYVKWVKVESIPLTDVPIAEDITIYTTDDNPVTFQLEGSDSQNRSLTYTVVTAPANGVTTNTSNQFTYTPNGLFIGVDTLVYKVNNGIKDSSNATVTINISASSNYSIINTFIHTGSSLQDAIDNLTSQTNTSTNTLFYRGNNVDALTSFTLVQSGLLILQKEVFLDQSKTVAFPDGYFATWYVQPPTTNLDKVAFKVFGGRIVDVLVVPG